MTGSRRETMIVDWPSILLLTKTSRLGSATAISRSKANSARTPSITPMHVDDAPTTTSGCRLSSSAATLGGQRPIENRFPVVHRLNSCNEGGHGLNALDQSRPGRARPRRGGDRPCRTHGRMNGAAQDLASTSGSWDSMPTRGYAVFARGEPSWDRLLPRRYCSGTPSPGKPEQARSYAATWTASC